MSENEVTEVEIENFYPFIQPPQWVLFSGIDARAFKLYCIMFAHVGMANGKSELWPSQQSLAHLMGLKGDDSIPGLLGQLYAIEAITVKKFKDGLVKRNRYTIKSAPPKGWNKPISLAKAYEDAEHETAGQPVPEKQRVRTRETTGLVPPKQRVKQEQLHKQQQLKEDEKLPPSVFRTPQAAHEEKPGSELQLFEQPPASPPSMNLEKPKTQRRKGTRIPEHFQVTADMVAWATENTPGVDGRYETAKFCDYWRAKSGTGATKLDWVATWRNWMRTAQDRVRGSQFAPAARNGVGDTQAWLNRSMERAVALDAAVAAGVPVAGVWG